MEKKNKTYWAYNVPLQVWPCDDGTCQVLNYMPRRERVMSADLEDLKGEDETREEFFSTAAEKLENLAALMRRAAKDEKFTVYYHDADPNEPNDE